MSHQASIDAKRREIGLKYQRTARQRGNTNLRWGELRRLFRERGLHDHEVDNAIVDAVSHDVFQWSAEQLGQLVELTFREQISLGIRTFRAHDVSEATIREHYRGKRRHRDRVRKARDRAERPTRAKPLSDRATALLAALSGQGWLSASELVNRSSTLRAFRNSRGRELDGNARRLAVHRAVKELTNETKIEAKKQPGDRGLSLVYVRALH